MNHVRAGIARIASAMGCKLGTSGLSISEGDRTRRRAILALVLLFLLAFAGVGAYTFYPPTPEVVPDVPVVADVKEPLPQKLEFEQLAQIDPVEMLRQSLLRYQREFKGGFRAELSKHERVNGELLKPERISVFVRGDVPDPKTGKTQIEVLMKWLEGAQEVMFSEVTGTLYCEEKNKDQMITFRPDARLLKEHAVSINGKDAKNASRYCIRDAGLYHVTLRTYDIWKQRKEEGTFKSEYLGKRPISEAAGVECYVVKRTCLQPEVDAFELGGKPDASPDTMAKQGFTEVTVMIDVKNWLQVGTELRRSNGELIGAYYYRNVELNPEFAADIFDKNGLLKKKPAAK
jgi:hypothetical protein